MRGPSIIKRFDRRTKPPTFSNLTEQTRVSRLQTKPIVLAYNKVKLDKMSFYKEKELLAMLWRIMSQALRKSPLSETGVDLYEYFDT